MCGLLWCGYRSGREVQEEPGDELIITAGCDRVGGRGLRGCVCRRGEVEGLVVLKLHGADEVKEEGEDGSRARDEIGVGRVPAVLHREVGEVGNAVFVEVACLVQEAERDQREGVFVGHVLVQGEDLDRGFDRELFLIREGLVVRGDRYGERVVARLHGACERWWHLGGE